MSELIPGTPNFAERLLRERIGLDVASVGEGLIQRGVAARMKRLGIRREQDYERILLGPSDEIQALIEEVVIPESWFFRDDRPFVTFRDFVREGWVAAKPGRPVTVLCLPCASGEEPYSVAITMLELGLAPRDFEVVAIDISEKSIRRAAAGLYTQNAFRGMEPRLQAEYFTPSQGKFLLKPLVRSAVRFERGNILDGDLMAAHGGFDVVFCRNLLIYFDDQARAKAFANLDRLTTVGGLLFLGHADRADQAPASRFVPFAGVGSFAFRKQPLGAAVAPPPVVPPIAPIRRPAAPLVAPPAASKPPPPAVPPPVPPVPAPAAVVGPVAPSREVSPTPSVDRDQIMSQAASLADQGRYLEANRLVRQVMERNSLDAPAHYLLGTIQQAIGNRAEAEAELTKAIYLDPDHDEALLAMALLARRKGDMAAEAFYRRRAERVLTRKGRS